MKLYEAIEYLEGMRILFPGGPGAESIDIAIECIMKEIQRRRAIAKNDLERMVNDFRRRVHEQPPLVVDPDVAAIDHDAVNELAKVAASGAKYIKDWQVVGWFIVDRCAIRDGEAIKKIDFVFELQSWWRTRISPRHVPGYKKIDRIMRMHFPVYLSDGKREYCGLCIRKRTVDAGLRAAS